MTAAAASDAHVVRRRGRLVVVLTGLSGYVDAVGVVALGGAFTSVMTGNLVLTGIGLARSDWHRLALSALAIVAYLAGCMVGGRITARGRDPRPWPAVSTLTLRLEFALLLASAVGWWLAAPADHPGLRLPLLLLNAAGLGLQSAAVARFGVPGLSTTYLTGTLTSLAIAVATGKPWTAFRAPLLQILVLIGAGALGTLVALHSPAFVPVVPLAALLVVLVAAPRRDSIPVGIGPTGQAG